MQYIQYTVCKHVGISSEKSVAWVTHAAVSPKHFGGQSWRYAVKLWLGLVELFCKIIFEIIIH